MIDEEVLDHGSKDGAQRFARLALTCVAKKGMERPTMIEVTSELWRIQDRDSLSELQVTITNHC